MAVAEDHALYRFYGDDGSLLYVGITNDPSRRFTQHAAGRPWWREVRGISVERYPDRPNALAAEKRCIDIERPKYNIQRPSLRKASLAVAAAPRLQELTWICSTCDRPVGRGEGYIHVSFEEINRVENAYAAWRRDNESEVWSGITLDTLMQLPPDAKWQVHHDECDGNPEANDYWIAIGRVLTHADLLRATAHLMGKTWLEHTNWKEVIERASGGAT